MDYLDIIDELMQFEFVFEHNSYAYKKLVQILAKRHSTTLIGLGAGRMGYSLRAFIMRLGHMGLRASMIGDTDVPKCDKKTTVIINSSSGETPSMLLFAKQAKNAGTFVILITSKEKSSISKFANFVFCYNERYSSQVMKTLYEQFTYLFFDKLASDLQKKLDIPDSFMECNHSILE